MAEESMVELMKERDEHGLLREQEIVPGAPEEAGVLPETMSEKEEGKYQELLDKVAPTKTATTSDDQAITEEDVILDAKHIGALTDEESKVQKLLDLASAKGVVHAVKVARSLKDYYALDQMHDALANKLYEGLLEKGMISKE